MSGTPPSAEHKILTYIRVQDKLNQLDEGIPFPVEIDSTLSKALNAMSCIPFIQFPMILYYTTPHKCTLTVAGADAGTLGQPNIDIILQNSTPLPFGWGSENVMDPSYNSGHKISAIKLEFGDTIGAVLGYPTYVVKVAMFPGCQIELKLYKLIVCEYGGHFDWHMDSTHSDGHHATLLMALNTSWKGGDLVLQHNNVETHVNLQPQSGDKKEPILQAVAFFMDTEHHVEPVMEGIGIVLQYDIEVGEKEECKQEYYNDKVDIWLHRAQSDYSTHMEFQGAVQTAADKVAVEKVLDIIAELHKLGIREVAFALQYLYCKASISAQYLKVSGTVLYNALLASGAFQVCLHLVVLMQVSVNDGESNERYAYCFDDDVGVDTTASSNGASLAKKTKTKKITREFHVPKLSVIKQISTQDYVEHMGNSAMEAEYCYFGEGIFVHPNSPNINNRRKWRWMINKELKICK